MTGFVKTCIVYTSTFSTLGSHKFYQELQIDVKSSRIVELLCLYHSWKFQPCPPFSVVLMHLQMSKIGCVNYAPFPKSGHIYWLCKHLPLGNILPSLINQCLTVLWGCYTSDCWIVVAHYSYTIPDFLTYSQNNGGYSFLEFLKFLTSKFSYHMIFTSIKIITKSEMYVHVFIILS